MIEYGTKQLHYVSANLTLCIFLNHSGLLYFVVASKISIPFRVHIDGLCRETLFDTEYALINIGHTSGGYYDAQILYIGKFGSTIVLDRGSGR